MQDEASAQIVRQIDVLEASARLLDAAALAIQAGMHARAAQLYEQACEFSQASDQAALAGDSRKALVLAALSGCPQRIARTMDVIVEQPNRARATAEELRARGHAHVAARLLERVGDKEEAALAYADAGLAVQAATIFEDLGQTREAARVLESALRASPQDYAAALKLASLLTTHRRFDAAVRWLQTIPDSSPLHREALPWLATCFEALGLEEPAAQARQQLQASEIANVSSQPKETGNLQHVVYGRYEIVESVASTPYAQVFRALDRMTLQPVAVKQLRSESVQGAGRDAFERFLREARALSMLRHANVVPLVELVERAGAIITPWMEGGSLADLMNRERITPKRAVEISCAILTALAEGHRLGILHRDIKPSNILFDQAGVPRLADFGAAHLSDASHTATAGVIGTFAYMSPEQRLGMPATPASDVFGVGASLLEMLTGRPPAQPGSALTTPSSCHPDLGPNHDAVVFALVADDPAHRIGHALDARTKLQALSWPDYNLGSLSPIEASPVRHESRLQRLAPNLGFDVWLGRRVLLVADSPKMRQVMQAWTRTENRNLSAVLRYDVETAMFWVEVPEGKTLSETARSLTKRQGEQLAAALGSLHENGVTHGAVDEHHLVMRDDRPVLCLDPDTAMRGSPDMDRESLRRLCSHTT